MGAYFSVYFLSFLEFHCFCKFSKWPELYCLYTRLSFCILCQCCLVSQHYQSKFVFLSHKSFLCPCWNSCLPMRLTFLYIPMRPWHSCHFLGSGPIVSTFSNHFYYLETVSSLGLVQRSLTTDSSPVHPTCWNMCNRVYMCMHVCMYVMCVSPSSLL